jgi:phytoene/squalene synthetase
VAGARPGKSGPATPDAVVAAKAAGENFPVALRLLPSAKRRYLMAVYVFARTADDIGDRAPVAERAGLLAELEADVRRLYSGTPPNLPAVRGLRAAVGECDIPMQPFLDLINANRQD